jgi:hypothetical protein
MSTKIYNGYEIVGHTLESFLAALRTLKPELERLARKLTARQLAQLATSRFDFDALGLDKREMPPLTQALLDLHDRQGRIERTRERDTVVDFSFELVVLPVEDTLLAMVYTEQEDMRLLWQAQPWCREFGYWDNTDQPEGVSGADWAERARLWKAALGDWYTPPAQAGYAFTALPVDGCAPFPFPAEELLPFIPSVEHRAREIAYAQLAQQAARASKDFAISDLLRLRDSPEHRALAQAFEPKLIAPLTAEHLTAGKSRARAPQE